MRCVMVRESVKVFARAIHCLAKIGFEVYLEPHKTGLSLRTVNSARSAYSCFIFHKDFFLSFDDGITESTSEDGVKCKLSAKSCLAVFKSPSVIARVVDRCTIKLNDPEEQLTFILLCKHGILKTYNLSYQECESLQAIFTKDLSPNLINVQPRILNDVVVNFQNNQEEISFTVTPQKMVVSNYIDENQDKAKVISTQMILVSEEFEKFQIGVDTEVTFCLKEFKALILFAETLDQNVSIHFESSGKPIVFSLNGDLTFEANFVFATLMDVTNSQLEQMHGERSTTNDEQGMRQRQSNSNDDFAMDGEEDWVNEAIAVEQQMSQMSTNTENYTKQKPTTSNDFADDFMKEKSSLFSRMDPEKSPGIQELYMHQFSVFLPLAAVEFSVNFYHKAQICYILHRTVGFHNQHKIYLMQSNVH